MREHVHRWTTMRGDEPEFVPNRQGWTGLRAHVVCVDCGTRTWVTREEWSANKLRGDTMEDVPLPGTPAEIRSTTDYAEWPGLEGVEPLPCPFCGEAPERRTSDLHVVSAGIIMHEVRCATCHAGTRWFRDAVSAVEAWQGRSDPCRVYEHDGAYKCFAHGRIWGDVTNPDEPCSG